MEFLKCRWTCLGDWNNWARGLMQWLITPHYQKEIMLNVAWIYVASSLGHGAFFLMSLHAWNCWCLKCFPSCLVRNQQDLVKLLGFSCGFLTKVYVSQDKMLSSFQVVYAATFIWPAPTWNPCSCWLQPPLVLQKCQINDSCKEGWSWNLDSLHPRQSTSKDVKVFSRQGCHHKL